MAYIDRARDTLGVAYSSAGGKGGTCGGAGALHRAALDSP